MPEYDSLLPTFAKKHIRSAGCLHVYHLFSTCQQIHPVARVTICRTIYPYNTIYLLRESLQNKQQTLKTRHIPRQRGGIQSFTIVVSVVNTAPETATEEQHTTPTPFSMPAGRRCLSATLFPFQRLTQSKERNHRGFPNTR